VRAGDGTRAHRESTWLSGSCGRTRLAYKARFGHEVPEDNEAWGSSDALFSRPEPVQSYLPAGNGTPTRQTMLISPLATVAEMLDSLDIPADVREGLEPLNAPRTARILDIKEADPGRPCVSVFFMGPADVARRALPEDIRCTTQILVRNFALDPFKTLVFRVDVSEHGDFVIELKKMVQERLGIPPSAQLIQYEGKLLDDHRRLRDYGVVKESSLSVSVRWC
jgi:hypothetical protein